MWPWASKLRLGLLGNPENRRVIDFAAAWQALGYPAPLCLAYEEWLSDPGALSRLRVDLLRIDSPGENERVTQALLGLVGVHERLDFGEIGSLREYHQGFCELLKRVTLPCLNAPTDIALMFDKWACHQRFVARGLARPPSRLAPPDLASLLREQACGRLFLKPLHGSSASGVCALRWTERRMELIAPLRLFQGPKLLNCLEVRRYTSRPDIEQILGLLLPQGMIAEQWIPKLTLDKGAVDLRVLVIAGQARHRVVRQSRHPMTNLHLGNQRGDEGALRQYMGSQRFDAALHLAEAAAACFPQSLYAGVDILIDHKLRPLVGEINAFGDLLPRLTDRGQSAYTAIAEACHAQSCLV